MKAIVYTKYGPPEVLQLNEVEKPVPRNNEVLIKIFATAVTASDCIIRGFRLPAWHPMGLAMRVVIGFSGPRKPILGMVLAGEALLSRSPLPTRSEIREAISGNLCRCTGYQQIVDAIEATARQRHAARIPQEITA